MKRHKSGAYQFDVVRGKRGTSGRNPMKKPEGGRGGGGSGREGGGIFGGQSNNKHKGGPLERAFTDRTMFLSCEVPVWAFVFRSSLIPCHPSSAILQAPV